jgi:phage terminase Nu1 subunit (DNA packaging protein)
VAASAKNGLVTQAVAAAHIDIGPRRFRDLVDEGVFSRSADGRYALDDVRVHYIRHLRKGVAGHGGADLAVSRAALAREQTASVSFRNAVMRGEFVSVQDVIEQVESNYAVVRQALLTLPGKLADTLANQDRAIVRAALEAEIIETLTELSQPSVIAERASGRS